MFREGKEGVSKVCRALWRYPRNIRTHFKHTAPTLGAVVRTLGLRLPANAAPPPGLRIIVRRRRGIEQRIFNANFVTASTATDVVGILRFGLWDGPWVACHAGDEGAEGEEGKGVDDNEVDDKVQWGMSS
jgi:hypothetical protein